MLVEAHGQVALIHYSVGPEGNVLMPEESDCHRLQLQSPVLTTAEFIAIAAAPQSRNWRSTVIDITYRLDSNLEQAVSALCSKAEYAVRQGAHFLILSDMSADSNSLAIPALMYVRLIVLYQKVLILKLAGQLELYIIIL